MADVRLNVCFSFGMMAERKGSIMPSERVIELSGATNCRSLGGMKTADGRKIRNHVLLRCCEICGISDEDCRILKDQAGLAAVIDLRTPSEAAQRPDRRIPGVRYYSMPVFTEAKVGITHEEETRKQGTTLIGMEWLYRMMVCDESCRKAFSDVLHFLIGFDYTEGSVLWHCSEGKDRCGLTAAFTEALLGVPEEDILADYLYTNIRNGPRNKAELENAVRSGRITREEADQAWLLYSARNEYLFAAQKGIQELFGNIDSFLRDGLMITEEEKQIFRKKVLTDS